MFSKGFLRIFKPQSLIKPSRHYQLNTTTPLLATSKYRNSQFRSIHHTKPCYRILFFSNENEHAFSVTRKKAAKQLPTLQVNQEVSTEKEFEDILNRDWRSSNITDIVNAFLAVKNYCARHDIPISDTRFDKLVDGLMDHCEYLSDRQLLDLLQALTEYPTSESYTSHNMHDVWSCLDDVCCWKMYHWDVDTMLMFASVWYKLHMGKICDYVYEVLDRLCKQADYLNKDQVVQVFFFHNVCRRRPVDFQYEHALERVINQMDIDEMAVVALGYFKTQSKIKIDAVKIAIINKIAECASTVHQISLTAIMKVLTYSNTGKHIDIIQAMLKKLVPEISRLPEICCLHIALYATGLQTFNKDILQKVSQKIVKSISDTEKLRVKDIERMLNVLTMFNFTPKTDPDIFKECFDEIHSERRRAEFELYPRCLASALNYFSLRSMFSEELSNKVLSQDFIHGTYGKAMRSFPRELMVLDASIDIEFPEYKGNKLTPNQKYRAVKYQVLWPTIRGPEPGRKVTALDKLVVDIASAVRETIKEERFMVLNHVLPHHPLPDLILCKNKQTGEFVEPKGLEKYILGDIMRPPNTDTLEWIAIMILGWNNTIRASSLPLGLSIQKERQLKMIGYSPRMVSWYEFLSMTENQRVQYMASKLM